MLPRPPSRIVSLRPSAWSLAVAAALALALVIPSGRAGTRGILDLETIDLLLSRAQPGQANVRLGDMLFPVDDLRNRREALLRQSRTTGRTPRSAVTTDVRLWPNGVVPYRFEASVNSTQRAQFLAACREWESVANVKFVPATTQAGFVRVFSGGGNFATVGYTGREQVLSMFNWDLKFIICHELAHTLGVWHEQNRSDRDRYVTIQTANIQPGQEHNFAKLNTTNLRAYDFDSVMHYGRYDFSINNLPTIVPKPGYDDDARNMGQYRFLSAIDIQGMIDLYGPSGAVPQLSHVGSVKVLDELGNENNRADRGELINLQVTVRNGGRATASGVGVTLQEDSAYATVGTTFANLGDIAAGASATHRTLSLNIAPNAPFGHLIPLTFTYTSGDRQWQATARVAVAQLTPPTISPAGGTFNASQTVSITTTPSGQLVHYTINGGAPTSESPIYQGPFVVAENAIVRAIAVTEDDTPSAPAAASFVIAKPVTPFDTALRFTDRLQPAGWNLDIDLTRIDQVTWENQRLEVFGAEAYAAIARTLPLPAPALGLRTSFVATVPATGDAGTALQIILDDDRTCSIEVRRENGEARLIAETTPRQPLLALPLPAAGGTFRVTAELAGPQLTLGFTPEGAGGTPTSEKAELLLDVKTLKQIRLVAYSTTGEVSAMDDVEIAAIYAAVQSRPPTAPRLLKVASATGRSLLVSFAGQDPSVLRYTVEARSQSARGKWSAWRAVRLILPRRMTTNYSTDVPVPPTARRHQVRVKAENTGGTALSRLMTVTARKRAGSRGR